MTQVKCDDCNTEFEIELGEINDPCPECGCAWVQHNGSVCKLQTREGEGTVTDEQKEALQNLLDQAQDLDMGY